MLRLPVIAALDADSDGLLSAEEIENASAALKKLDRNEDGKIDFVEMRPELDRFGRGDPPPFVRRPGEGDRRPSGRDWGSLDRERMLELVMQRDRDNDGKLTEEETPGQLRRFFERFDVDEDGKLSKDELGKGFARVRELRGGDRPGPRGARGGDTRDGDRPGGERPRRPPVAE
jgi:Ca2+-binding EF-hand superfamily protein